jgi:hypothetical protein
LISNGKVTIAARRHSFESLRRNGMHEGHASTIIDHTWHSRIVLGETTFDAGLWEAWPRIGKTPFEVPLSTWTGLETPRGGPWAHLCVYEHWIPENSTLIRHVVTGPEDPKVVSLGNAAGVAFNSRPPLGVDACHRKEDHSQMYIASYSGSSGATTGHHLDCGHLHETEKNWIPFTKDNQLYFVYTVVPHAVAVAGVDGTCKVQSRTTFTPLRRLQQQGLRVRGSGQAVLVDDTLATPNLPRKHYLALLHVVDPVKKSYVNYAYRFGSDPPFPILQVSSQLPLSALSAGGHSKVHGKVPFAFASGLALVNRTVVITYGSGDREARALVLTLERIDKMFECTNKSHDTARSLLPLGRHSTDL